MTVNVSIPPYNISVSSNISLVFDNLLKLYPKESIGNNKSLIDYEIAVNYSGLVRRFVRPQCVFSFDGFQPFKGLPR